jgi:hypothetical protein
MVHDEARRVIGEGYAEWPALAPSTLARKMLNTPLLETRELRASIEWQSHGLEGAVGSNNDKAVWHELGTARIPPRSFLAGAAMAMEYKIHKMAARATPVPHRRPRRSTCRPSPRNHGHHQFIGQEWK